MKKQLTASSLRAVLTVIIVLLISISIAGFYFGQLWLRSYADTVRQTVADAEASRNDVQALEKLQKEIAVKQTVITKANGLVADRENYQNQAINDIDRYANNAGLKISNYNFAAGAVATTPPIITTPAGLTATTATRSTPTVTVTLTSPVSYTGLLTFIRSIETNLPKMQVSSVSLGRLEGSNENVKIDQLTIEVYSK